MNKKEVLLTANEVRKGIIVGTFHAKSGHPGGSLSATECIVYLYFNVMNIDPKDPEKPDREPNPGPEKRTEQPRETAGDKR